MPLPLLAAAGISLAPSLFKLFKGIGQGGGPVPVDPGYQINNDVVDNARILGENYNNYQLPGYNQTLNNLNTSYQSAFSGGVQGASSGGDVLDLANKLAYGKANDINSLGIQTANAKQNALANYLNSKSAAGQQYQDKNAYDRQNYQAALRARAAKQEASAQNVYGGLDTIANTATKFLMPQATLQQPGVDTTSANYQNYLSQLAGQNTTNNIMGGINDTEAEFNKYLRSRGQ